METETAFARIRVPIHWAGQIRPLTDGTEAWTCGACQHPDACAEDGDCQRASDDDLNAHVQRNWGGLIG